ncbi:MAG: 3-phosphoshikimate 1-carboxyvinyltransferase [Xanthomonadales bacterium]|nr:3-phosphoshikimate 1-carboxyvinyltransferase [Xanthomonadales bacterium]
MLLTSEPARKGLRGVLNPPGDKSISHRALIFACLAKGRSRITGLLESEDTLATLGACEQLGAVIERIGSEILVSGTGGKLSPPLGGVLEMGNSGTAMRLLAGVLAGQGFDCTLSGDVSLNQRPMRRIVVPLELMGADISTTAQGTAPIRIHASGSLNGIDYVSPVASAQIKSCVLLAGLFASGTTRLSEPRLSRDHTERMLPMFGVELPAPCTVNGGARLRATRFVVPGDISSAVFSLAAAAMVPGSSVRVRGVGLNPTRTGFLRCLEAMGADLAIENQTGSATEPVGDVRLNYRAGLKGIDVPEALVPDMIDEMPLLMALAARVDGVTRIRGAAELRVKESDRLAVMAAGLHELGVEVEEYPDGIDIRGGAVNGGRVASAGDHRCAMSFAVLGLRAAGPVEIEAAEYIATSYPGFSADMEQLGARMQVGERDE